MPVLRRRTCGQTITCTVGQVRVHSSLGMTRTARPPRLDHATLLSRRPSNEPCQIRCGRPMPDCGDSEPLAREWWAWVDSNYRPHPYQLCPENQTHAERSCYPLLPAYVCAKLFLRGATTSKEAKLNGCAPNCAPNFYPLRFWQWAQNWAQSDCANLVHLRASRSQSNPGPDKTHWDESPLPQVDRGSSDIERGVDSMCSRVSY
jgi:hypothetical protein